MEIRYSSNWIVYDANGNQLRPRTYDDSKPQDALVDEVVASLRGPYRYIILRASTGSGKSVMIMSSVGSYIGRPSSGLSSQRSRATVLTPTNALAKQYYEDFMLGRYRLVKDGITLSVAVLFGKDKYKCALDGKFTALNAKCSTGPFSKRFSCPMYKPTVTKDIYAVISSGFRVNAVPYECVDGICYYIMRPGTGCKYYDDLAHYISASIIVTNPWKYVMEFERGTLPSSSVVAVDEFDGVFTSMVPIIRLNTQTVQSLISKFNMHGHRSANKLLEYVRNVNVEPHDVYYQFIDFVNATRNIIQNEFRQCVEETKDFTKCMGYAELLQDIVAYVRKIEHEFSSARVLRYKNSVVIIGDLRSFTRMMKPKVLLVSATLLPESVLESLGIDDYIVIEGPKRIRGKIYAVVPPTVVYASKTSIMSDPEYAETYAKALRDAVKLATYYKPVFVSVPAYWVFDHEMVRAALSEVVDLDDVFDRDGSKILELRDGKRDVVISAYATRGIDLSYDRCRAVVIPKLPIPDIESAEILATAFNESRHILNYLTLANLYHTISRAVRGDGDWAVITSPDVRTYIHIKRLERLGYINVEWFKAPIPKEGLDQMVNEFKATLKDDMVEFPVSQETVKIIEHGNVDVLNDLDVEVTKLGDVKVLDPVAENNSNGGNVDDKPQGPDATETPAL